MQRRSLTSMVTVIALIVAMCGFATAQGKKAAETQTAKVTANASGLAATCWLII